MDIQAIVLFSERAQRGNFRKGPNGLPAFWHACDTVKVLLEHGVKNNDCLCLAYIHDILEDTNTTLDEPEEGDLYTQPQLKWTNQSIAITREAAADLKQLTNPQHMSKEDRKAIEIMMAGRLGMHGGYVRIADKISNVRSLSFDRPIDWTDTRVKDYKAWALKVGVAASRAFSGGTMTALFETLEKECKV